MVTILLRSAKLATLGFLKIKLIWNKGHDVIISVNGVTHKLLSRDSNYIVGVVMWPKFDNSSISMREVIIRIWPEKLISLRGDLGSSSIIFDWH